MTDRADELARQTAECFHILNPLPAFPDAQTFLPGMWDAVCLAEHRHKVTVIADALRAYAEEARREEREACAKQIKSYCDHKYGHVEGDSDWCVWYRTAAAIRARGEKEAHQ